MGVSREFSNRSHPRVAVVTGASAGVGRAVVRELARRGWRIGLIARGREGLEGACKEVESLGSRALILPCDVADDLQVENAAAEVEEKLGPIDAWINNAMVSVFAPVQEITPEEYRRVTEVTYLGYVYGTLAALKRMRSRDRGVIVQVGSSLAYRSIPLQSAYCAAKHAVNGFTESLRTELLHGRSRIQVTQVHLPAVNTPQFGWSRAKLPREPKPVPPIFQPEVAAQAIVHAVLHPRREFYVGFPSVKAILGERFAPRIADRVLAKMGYQAQQSDQPIRPDRRDNLYEPLPGDAGAHGTFDREARRSSRQLSLSLHRGGLAVAAASVSAWIWARRRRRPELISRELTPSEFPMSAAASGAFGQGRLNPECLTLLKDWTRLSTSPCGEMNEGPLQGFFVAGTRLMTHYRLWINDQPLPKGLTVQASGSEWSGLFSVLTDLSQRPDEGALPEGSVEARILRKVDGGWSERIRIRNYDSNARRLLLRMELRCPIDDVEFEEEMKVEGAVPRGVPPEVSWKEGHPILRFSRDFGRRQHAPTEELKRVYGDRAPHDGDPVRRGIELRLESIEHNEGRFRVEPGELTRVMLELELPPKASYEFAIRCDVEIDGRRVLAPEDLELRSVPSAPSPGQEIAPGPRIRTGNSTLNLILDQARVDLRELELSVFDPGGEADPGRVGFNAGVPRYIGMFSRDILTTAWQSALFTPRYMEAAVRRLALYRGVRSEPWRDEEPNRLPHERRLNPLAALGASNREIYYGDVASTPFWIVTLAQAYNWTGDRALLREHEEALGDCCEWMERKLREGGGFVYYSPAILDGKGMNRNHAWKDSDDAVVDGQGKLRLPPLAAAEIQGYCYLAMLSAQEMAVALGQFKHALRLREMASKLKRDFNARFWMPDRRFFAFALDRDGRAVDAISSNVGQCLGTGLLDADKARLVAERLFSREMFSGWGIRTLSDDNPSYDPFSYHRGSVWPVENASIAAGLAMIGYQNEAARLASAQFSLATLFPRMRLPEVISGHARGPEYPTPGIYPDANLLQAWSVSAISLYLQVLLGIRAYAPLRALLVKPALPEWLPWVEIENLQVGSARVSLRFWRDERGQSRWKVLDREGALVVLEQSGELDPEVSWKTRIMEGFKSVA